MRRIIFTGILVAIIAVIGVVFYVFYKPKRTAESEKPAYKLKAAQLFDEYSVNEKKANSLYLDKTIEVEGPVSEITTDSIGTRTVVLKKDEDIFGVACTIDEDAMKDKKLAAVKEGDMVIIKGICMGFDVDVKLNKCVIVGLSKEKVVPY